MTQRDSIREIGADEGVQTGTAADDLSRGVAGLNRFAFRLYGKLANTSRGNLFFSPFSISAALAMTHTGARGQTANEIRQALDLPQGNDYVDAQLGSLWKGVSGEGYLLRIANRLWGQIGEPFLPEFLRITRDLFGAELAAADFASRAEIVRGEINAWVEKITAGKIRDLLASGVLNALTRLVLVNAIYFKGEWTRSFNKNATKDEPFHVGLFRKVRAPLMHQQEVFLYARVRGVQILGLPYGDNRFSMLALLPSRWLGVRGLERRLSESTVAKWRSQLDRRVVQVYLPRFKLEMGFRLEGLLQAMGIRLAFRDSQADFSGINGKKDLHLSTVIHRAFAEVNEEGTEAAAATAMFVDWMSSPRSRSRPPAIPIFRADRPFNFLIQENRTGAILFIGRVVNPLDD